MNKLACVILLLICTLPSFSAAQNLESLGGQSGALSIRTVPAHPAPRQLVTVIIESFSVDLDRAHISWFLNNNLAKEAAGQKTFSFKTGSPGSVSNILIVVQTLEGETVQETLNIRPASVDVLWEAVSYTPPFYKGKSLYPFQGTAKVVALPNIVTAGGGTLSAKNLVYNWKVNGNPAATASGYGKNFIFFKGGVPLKPATVSVEVSSTDEAYVAEGSTVLVPVQPGVVFYEESPLVGTVYSRALSGNVTLRNEEIKIAAIPYFLGVAERERSGLTYKWQMNGQKITGSTDKSTLTFRQEKGVTGSAAVSLEVSNPAKIFQTASTNLSLFFGKTAEFSPF